MNPKADFATMQDEDDKWLKKLQQKNVERVVTKTATGKVKKGSGLRYDRKKGYKRYFSSSEEETASEDESDDGETFFQPVSSAPWGAAPQVY
mgnify:CR=1 FL=1